MQKWAFTIFKDSFENNDSVQFSSVQSLSCVRLFATPWIAARQASLSITNSPSSLKLTSIESVMPSSHLILCLPLFLLPPIPPSKEPAITESYVERKTFHFIVSRDWHNTVEQLSLNKKRKKESSGNSTGWCAPSGSSLVAQMVKNLPTMPETWVQFLGHGPFRPGWSMKAFWCAGFTLNLEEVLQLWWGGIKLSSPSYVFVALLDFSA